MIRSSDMRLLPFAATHPTLKDFIEKCSVTIRQNGYEGTFDIFVPYSNWLWRPVQRQLDKECYALLQPAFNALTESNLQRPQIVFDRHESHSYTVDWQIDAYRRGIFDYIDNLQTPRLDKETGRVRA